MGRGKPPPRILSVKPLRRVGNRFTVEVTTTDVRFPVYELDMTEEQMNRTWHLVHENGSAPIPTGEYA